MKSVVIVIVTLVVLVTGYGIYMAYVANPRVERELREDPDGERARKVMLMTLPSGRSLPVNYIREADTIYAAADGRWWREIRGQGARVALLVGGQNLVGQARAIEDDPELRSAVFDRLRPSAPKVFATLVHIDLESSP